MTGSQKEKCPSSNSSSLGYFFLLLLLLLLFLCVHKLIGYVCLCVRVWLICLGCPGIHYGAQAGLESKIFLSQPLKGWDYRLVPPCVRNF